MPKVWTSQTGTIPLMRLQVQPIPNVDAHWCVYITLGGLHGEPPIGNALNVTFREYDPLTRTTMFGWDFEGKDITEVEAIKFAEEMAAKIVNEGAWVLQERV